MERKTTRSPKKPRPSSQRAKGATKDAVGDLIDDEEMEAEGKLENAAGRARQAANKVTEETDGVLGRTVTPSGYVTGLYSTPESAGRAYEGLTTKHGYSADDINVLMSEDTRKRHFGDVKPGTELSGGTKAAEGLGKGAAIGGGIGAALAAIFAVGSSVSFRVSASSWRARSRRRSPARARAAPPAASSAR